MSVSRRRVGFVGVVVAGLMVLGGACSSSGKSSSSTTTVSVSAQCSQLKSLEATLKSDMASLQANLKAASGNVVGLLTQAQSDLANMATQMQDAQSSMPSAIASEWQTVTTAFTTFTTAFSAVNMNNITDPAVQAQMQAATDALNNNSAATQAGDAVDTWMSQNCGSSN
jgi:hypothetical protein